MEGGRVREIDSETKKWEEEKYTYRERGRTSRRNRERNRKREEEEYTYREREGGRVGEIERNRKKEEEK